MYSYLASPKTTIEVLQEFGLYTKKKLGQHFLVDDNIIRRIVELAALTPEDVALEVGPGIGVLTTALVDTGARIVAIEFDSDLPPVLQRTIVEHHSTPQKPLATFKLVQDDALKVERATIEQIFGAPTALVSNLPYQVAATIVLRYFELFETLNSATVMVQSEVADRMAATSGNKNYGAYTAKLNLLARATKTFAVSRSSFLPPPRVDSTVVRLDRCPLVSTHQEYEQTARVIDGAFAQRRKTLCNNLKTSLGLTPAQIDEALEACAVDGDTRAERLNAQQFIALARCIHQF